MTVSGSARPISYNEAIRSSLASLNLIQECMKTKLQYLEIALTLPRQDALLQLYISRMQELDKHIGLHLARTQEMQVQALQALPPNDPTRFQFDQLASFVRNILTFLYSPIYATAALMQSTSSSAPQPMPIQPPGKTSPERTPITLQPLLPSMASQTQTPNQSLVDSALRLADQVTVTASISPAQAASRQLPLPVRSSQTVTAVAGAVVSSSRNTRFASIPE